MIKKIQAIPPKDKDRNFTFLKLLMMGKPQADCLKVLLMQWLLFNLNSRSQLLQVEGNITEVP